MKTSAELQLDDDGRLRHLLTTESMSRELLTEILDTAAQFAPVAGAPVKKVPLLRGRTVLNLFFEASTRTRTTFELAATRLSADVLNIDAQTSSTSKGETLFDMQRTLEAMQVDMFVIPPTAPVARRTSSRNTRRRGSPCSTPAMGVTPTRRRRCSTCTPCAAIGRISRSCPSPSSVI